MNIEKIDIDNLKIIKSSRTTTAEEINLYKNLFKEYGVTIPIVINKENQIYLGTAKYLACKELDIKEIPCIKVEDLSEEDLKVISLAEQRANELGEWDYEELYKELISLGDKAFLTGFDIEAVKEMIEEELETPEEIEEIDTPEVKENYYSQPGDIYLLGNHKLMCGDSTKEEDIKKLVGNNKMDLMITDPPYNIDYEGSDGQKIKNDNMDSSEFKEFLNKFYKNAFNVMRDGASYYVFHADLETIAFREGIEKAGFKLSQCLIWVKNAFNLSRQDYNWRHEPCLYGWKEGAAHYFLNDYTQDTVIEDIENHKKKSKAELLEYIKDLHVKIDKYTTLIREDKPQRNDLHPTMKPLKLIARLMINSSKAEWNILDPFGGSGSTLMTAEQLNRFAFLMEYDPKYVDVIVKRFASTGNTNIKLIREGKEYSWEEIKECLEK